MNGKIHNNIQSRRFKQKNIKKARFLETVGKRKKGSKERKRKESVLQSVSKIITKMKDLKIECAGPSASLHAQQ